MNDDDDGAPLLPTPIIERGASVFAYHLSEARFNSLSECLATLTDLILRQDLSEAETSAVFAAMEVVVTHRDKAKADMAIRDSVEGSIPSR